MKLGILGASGAVGRQILISLEERNIIPDELRLFGSSSIGQKITFNNKEYLIEEPHFEGLDYLFGAASSSVSKKYKEEILKSGAIYIDNANAFRMDIDVPLVIPSINAKDIDNHKGIIANPNCTTIITLTALAALNKLSPIKAIYASSYQAVSGAGIGGIRQLEREIEEYPDIKRSDKDTFESQILNNCIPHIGNFLDNLYSEEEMKMQNEGRKIMHLGKLLVNCTCVRVPVMRSHSISVTAILEDEVSLDKIKEAYKKDPMVHYLEDDYPMPLDVSDQDIVFIGRLRKDLVNPKGITLWCVGDQIRKGAASNAIDILEYLLKKEGKC